MGNLFWNIELLYFAVMLAVFIVLLLAAKLPTGLSLMCSAVVGLAVAAIADPELTFDIRYLVEGMFGYLDTILTITTAMVFMGALQASGALEYISTVLVKALGRYPSLLLVALMIIIMFPAMVTGSSLASAISVGALVAPIMIKWGIPKSKTAAIIAMGSILGMVAPPVNVPAMVICDVVDIPYTGFTAPLILLTMPLALVSVILLGRKYVKPIPKAYVEKVVDTSVLKELNWTVCIPLFVLIALIVAEMIWPMIFGALAMPAMFAISTVIAFFVGRRRPFWKKPAEGLFTPQPAGAENAVPDCVVGVLRQGVSKSLSAMGLLMGVGMFMEVLAATGARGLIVYTAISLPDVWMYVGMAVSLPLFGGISAFGSASMLGGPFVMALNGVCNSIMVTSGLSMLAAIGEFSPPTAMSSTIATNITGEKKWTKTSLAALPALAVAFAYSLIYVLLLARIVQKIPADSQDMYIWIMFAVAIAIAIAFVVVWEILCRKVYILRRRAYDVTQSDETAEQPEEQAADDGQTAEASACAEQAEPAAAEGDAAETAEEPAAGSEDSGNDNNDNEEGER